jgi:hypothetical protein
MKTSEVAQWLCLGTGAVLGIVVWKSFSTTDDDLKKAKEDLKKAKEEAETAEKANDMSNYMSKEAHQKIIEEMHVAHAKAIKEEVAKAMDDLKAAMARSSR